MLVQAYEAWTAQWGGGRGLLPTIDCYDTLSATARDLFCDADDALFHKILYNKAHLLHMYLPDRSQIVYTLRNRNHNKILIPKTSDLNERHFLIRVLYKHCY